MIKWFSLIFFASLTAQAQFLVEGDDLRASNQSSLKTYDKSSSLLEERRMGIGLMVGGPTGFMGAQWQLNLFQDFAMTFGYGGSKGFQSFNLDFKDYLGSGQFSPFVGGGYARWTGKGSPLGRTTPQFLADNFLSGRERETGNFSENLIYPSFGLQWYSLGGDLAGLSIIAEVIYLIDIEDLVARPTAGISSMFFF